MITTEDKALFEHLASLAGWDVAKHFGCGYTGDSDPIQHGGLFYDPRDWATCGWANCVEFWEDPDTGALIVQRGTIHRPGEEYLAAALAASEADGGPASTALEIEAVRNHWGIEPDGTEYPDLMTFRLDDWHEWRIWKSVAGWLRALGE